jgi:hypothetical protein
MTSEAQKRAGNKKRTIHSITNDLMNGAWNNLDLSRSSKRALTTAGLIIVFGGAAAAFFILKKK